MSELKNKCMLVNCPYLTEEGICCFPEDYCYINPEEASDVKDKSYESVI
jgi:hypothetical protein